MKIKELINQYCIVSIVMFIIFFSGCKKGSSPPPAPGSYTWKFAIAGLEYVKLTPGKYLIYKDSASGILDSVVIIKSLLEATYSPPVTYTNFFGFPETTPEIYGEKFSLALTKVDGNSSIAWFTGDAATAGDNELNLFETYDLGTGTDYGNPSAFYYSQQYPVNTISTITIEGKNYTNVIVGEFENHTNANDPDYTKRTFYWAKGTGIVKRRIVTTGGKIKTDNLLRNN